MKYILPLFFLYGCTTKEETQLSRSPFPSYITLGPDLTYKKVDTVFVDSYSSYLATCGVSPEFEAPNMGIEVYQIQGPSCSIGLISHLGKEVPYFTNLSRGTYKFVGHGYMTGFRICDQTTQNVHVYDTLTLTIRNGRR